MKINAVVSLGTSCFASWICKKAQLKKFSCPFDWIFSDTDMVIDCMNTNFSIFLDANCYCKYLDFQKSATHKQYGNIFLHQDPRQPDDYDYFTRCVQRFQKLCENDSMNVLFLQAFYNKSHDQIQTIISQAEKLLITLSKHVRSKFNLLIVIHTTDDTRTYFDGFVRENLICKIMHVKEVLRNFKFIEKENNDIFIDYLLNNFEYDLVSSDDL